MSTDRRRFVALLVLCASVLMTSLDATVVNVALATIQRELHFSQASLAWVVDAYLITFGGLLLLAGRFGDLIGPKKVFITGFALFTVASALCGLSRGQGELIAARFLQGTGAAVVAATALGILVTMFPEPRARARAIGIYVFVASAGSAIGLLVGGGLTQALGWHWIFFINLPFGVVGLIVGAIVIEEQAGSGIRQGIDFMGALLVTGAPMLFVYAMVQSADYGWGSDRTIGPGVGAVILFAGFVLLERWLKNPILPFRIFRSRNLSTAVALRTLFPIGGLGVTFMGALYLQHVRHYSPALTGIAFLPQTVLLAVFSLVITSRIMVRVGARATFIGGALLSLVGLLLFARVPVQGSYLASFLPGTILVGAGLGLASPPSITLAMVDASPSDTGIASGIANVSVQMGSAIGVAVLASISSARTKDLLAAGSTHARALVGGYHIGFLITSGCLAAAALIAALALRDNRVGRVVTPRDQALDVLQGEPGG